MKRTKIVCTMGPSTDDPEILGKIIDSGMDVARFNFSHGTYPEQKKRMDLLKQVRREKKCSSSLAFIVIMRAVGIACGVMYLASSQGIPAVYRL